MNVTRWLIGGVVLATSIGTWAEPTAEEYAAFRAALGQCQDDAAYSAAYDLDGDGCVTYADYQAWLQRERGE